MDLEIFQSPFRRGNGCYFTFRPESLSSKLSFSPLFVGAMVATRDCAGVAGYPASFQSPFRRGNGCYLAFSPEATSLVPFQSPFRRGNGCYNIEAPELPDIGLAFSPLFVGAMVATRDFAHDMISSIGFQSPFRRGNGCYRHLLSR